MMNIYLVDGVQPSTCVRTCSTLEEAKDWVNKQLRGYTIVDADHPCTNDDYQSSKTAIYLVFDGEAIIIGKYGVPSLAEPIYKSDYFYTV